MKTYKMELAYDGTRYRGWQKQGNTPNTLQQKLEGYLSTILSQEIELAGSGRTDAGVHALCQTASFHAETDLPCETIAKRFREMLPDDIGLLSLTEAAPRFHARLNCKEKTYLYRLWVSNGPCVFERRYVWNVGTGLDIAKMREAAAYLCGEHDFSSFCTGHSKKSKVRRISSIQIEEKGSEWQLYYTGDGFLYNMVRILTGTLYEVGAGLRAPSSMPEILAEKQRSAAGITAPAQGLFLYSQKYEG